MKGVATSLWHHVELHVSLAEVFRCLGRVLFSVSFVSVTLVNFGCGLPRSVTHSSYSYRNNSNHRQKFRELGTISKMVCNVFTSCILLSEMFFSPCHSPQCKLLLKRKDFFHGLVLILEAMGLMGIRCSIYYFWDMVWNQMILLCNDLLWRLRNSVII